MATADSYLTRERLWEQYGRAVDEYRFQVDLNWRRSQYYFVLNAAILAAGIALLTSSSDAPDGVVIAVFVAGVAISALSLVATKTQHRYYQSSRDLKGQLEERLEVGDAALTTTPGQGSRLTRFLGKVTTFQTLMLTALAMADVVGLVAAVNETRASPSPAEVEIAGRVTGPGRVLATAASDKVVLSRDGAARAIAAVDERGTFSLRAVPGVYQAWALDGRCRRQVHLSNAPLQAVRIRCYQHR